MYIGEGLGHLRQLDMLRYIVDVIQNRFFVQTATEFHDILHSYFVLFCELFLRSVHLIYATLKVLVDFKFRGPSFPVY